MPAEVPTRLLHAIPDTRLARLPGVGRLVPEEAPDQLAELILGHVTRQEAALAAAHAARAELAMATRPADGPAAGDLPSSMAPGDVDR